jgi:hypothetical protein
MVNWTTGEPNARFWTLQMLMNNFGTEEQQILLTLCDDDTVRIAASRRVLVPLFQLFCVFDWQSSHARRFTLRGLWV